MQGAVPRSPFIGRTPELKAVREALNSARRGQGKLVFIYGEAGIGKTRLWQEAIAAETAEASTPVLVPPQARPQPYVVAADLLGGEVQFLLGCTYPEDVGIEFAPIADTLRNARRRPQDTLWRKAKEKAPVLSVIVPELGDLSATMRAAPVPRPVLFETLLDVVLEAAGSKPTFWVLEDLHWADPASWEFVVYTARRIDQMPLCVIVTFRPEEVGPAHPWRWRLASLRRQPNVVAVPLARLSDQETEALIASLAAHHLPPEVRATIVERSAGTPLFIEELVALASALGDSAAVPSVVRATVRQRMRQVGPAARELLEVAAVIGREMDLRLLLGLQPEQGQDSVEELVACGLLTISGDPEHRRVRFRHPLLQEAVYQDIPPLRRRQLHSAVAAALLNTAQEHLLERVAWHQELSGQPDAALATLLMGARQAREKGNIGRAAALGLSALSLVQRETTLAERRAEFLGQVLGDLYRAGRWTDIVPLARAEWARRDSLAPQERAQLANILGSALFYTGSTTEARTLLHGEIARLEAAGELPHALLLLTNTGYIEGIAGDTSTALRLAEQALVLARQSGDVEAEFLARYVQTWARYRRDKDRQAAAAAHRANAEFARREGLSASEVMACLAYARITTTLEDFIEAERVAERAGTRHILTARIAQAFIHILHGETEEAETLLQRVGPETREAVPLFASTIDTTEAHLLLHKGRLAEARDMLQASGRERYRDFLPSWENTRNSALGWLHWEEGDDESALQCFEECVRHCRETDYFPFATGPLLLPLHVDTLVRRGRAQEAGELIESLAALYRSPDRFFRASLAAARFRLHLSPELAARAIEAAEAAPWPWLLGLVEYWKGEFLRDSVAAQEAHRWFAAIGAVRAAERAFSLLRRMGMVRPPRSGRSAGATLTPREQEVAALVADGLSNAAIANRLFLSRATVASHIANILAKLNFTSRSQIAAWIAEQRRLHHSPVE